MLKNLGRLRSSKVRAVYDEDLIPMLKKAGVLEKINEGEVRCKFTNEVITLDNLEGIIPKSDGYDFVSANALRTGLRYAD
jgi:hypothetical protein